MQKECREKEETAERRQDMNTVRCWGEESEGRTTRASYARGFIFNKEMSGFTATHHHPLIVREHQQ